MKKLIFNKNTENLVEDRHGVCGCGSKISEADRYQTVLPGSRTSLNGRMSSRINMARWKILTWNLAEAIWR